MSHVIKFHPVNAFFMLLKHNCQPNRMANKKRAEIEQMSHTPHCAALRPPQTETKTFLIALCCDINKKLMLDFVSNGMSEE